MNNNVLRTGLEWMLITSLVVSGYCFVRFYFQSKSLRLIQPQYQAELMNNQRFNASVGAFMGEVAQYAQREPGLQRFLEAAGFGATNAPASKPAAK